MEADSVTPLKFKIVIKMTNTIAISHYDACKLGKADVMRICTSRHTYCNS